MVNIKVGYHLLIYLLKAKKEGGGGNLKCFVCEWNATMVTDLTAILQSLLLPVHATTPGLCFSDSHTLEVVLEKLSFRGIKRHFISAEG